MRPNHRNHRKGLFLLILAALLSAPPGATPQEPDQIREYVQVRQVELTVRVEDLTGEPVRGLTDRDFTIMENGAPVPITSCVEVHRSISPAAGKASPATATPRLFLVYFWVWQENEAYSRALDTLFEKIYRDGDTVILALPTDTRVIQKREEIPAVRREFEQELRDWTRQRTQTMASIVANLNRLLRDFIDNDRLLDSPPDDWGFRRAFETYKNSVLSDWRFFRSSYLDIPHRNFNRLAELLRTIKHQKWAIVFLQPSTFPTVHPNAPLWTRFEDPDQANMLRAFANDMIRVMNTPHEAPPQIQSIQQAFIRSNTTFHIIRMDTRRNEADANPDLVMQEVFSDRQWTFQRLAGVTGGRIISENIPERGLQRIASAEDVFYHLTYRPADSRGKTSGDQRRLVITTRNPRVRIHYARHLRLSDVEEIRLVEFHCDSSRVKFILTGYAVRMENNRLQSDVAVTVTAESPRGEVYSFQRRFDTPEPFLQVSMAVHFPASGNYRLQFLAEDRFTGRTARENQVIQVIFPSSPHVQSSGGGKP